MPTKHTARLMGLPGYELTPFKYVNIKAGSTTMELIEIAPCCTKYQERLGGVNGANDGNPPCD